ncbi:MAG: type I restriction endonuclease subunit R [Athalassotoga sp.]|uniref:type I restriction endonuclease subunit R n=1 Tax=Athalassotoga sp. TaxID=2022597 RepID=UPI003D011D57
MEKAMVESEIEEIALDILTELGYERIYGPDISKDGKNPERTNYTDVVLIDRFRSAIEMLNPQISPGGIDLAVRKVVAQDSPDLVESNRNFHRYLTNGVDVQYQRKDGKIVWGKVWLFDFENPENNEFLAVNQYTVIGIKERRPDIVLFVNGLPLAVIELKNVADEKATIWSAFNQLDTYKQQIPALFRFNEVMAISDGLEARAGALTSDVERFMPWKTIDGREIIELSPELRELEELSEYTLPEGESFSLNESRATESELNLKSWMSKGLPIEKRPQMEVLLRGVFEKKIFLDLVKNFIVFDSSDRKVIKKIAAYYQYHAVNKAIQSTLKAVSLGDKRCGVIWHTQGSGKSLSMVFYAGKIVLAMHNPTIVVITDRNDLDDQLFNTFSGSTELLRQTPVQAESREDLKEKLRVASGGIVFTTVQKFFPEKNSSVYPMLSDRSDIIVIADEAHRSQYDFMGGFAKYMRDALPNASFIGFTGTPISLKDRDTRNVFGDYIDVYDIKQSVNDKTTVKIYYESRIAKLDLNEDEMPHIDRDLEEVTEGEEEAEKERLKSKWATLEAVAGTEKRLSRIADDLVKHFEKRREVLNGKGMIVCMSRRIAVDLYNEIIKLRPEWHSENDKKGEIKIVMSGSASDDQKWQQHIRNRNQKEEIAKRFKNPDDPLKLVIVRDMWLTGFDNPCLHTMYIDKPMKGHTLMQAIARVNRVFKDKPGGLVVDYIGVAEDLRETLANYTSSGGRGNIKIDQNEAVAFMLEKFEILQEMFYGFDYTKFFEVDRNEKLRFTLKTVDFILGLENGKERFVKHVTELSEAFALSVPADEAVKISDHVAFFQMIKASILKRIPDDQQKLVDHNTAIKQILSKAIVSDGVVDLFESAGIKKPDLSILSDDFLAQIRKLPEKNLAVEMLENLINGEIKIFAKKNLIQSRAFSEMLRNSILKYKNRQIETAKVIEELIELAKDMQEARKRGEELGLSEDELAFYDALAENKSAVEIMGDAQLKAIALKLVETMRNNVTIDWTIRENVKADLRVQIKRLLRKYGYPPDLSDQAIKTVIEQAEYLYGDWIEN